MAQRFRCPCFSVLQSSKALQRRMSSTVADTGLSCGESTNNHLLLCENIVETVSPCSYRSATILARVDAVEDRSTISAALRNICVGTELIFLLFSIVLCSRRPVPEALTWQHTWLGSCVAVHIIHISPPNSQLSKLQRLSNKKSCTLLRISDVPDVQRV